MIQHSFNTTVAISVPVTVRGTFNKYGEFTVEEVALQWERGQDVRACLNQHDMDDIESEAMAMYDDARADYICEKKAEALEG